MSLYSCFMIKITRVASTAKSKKKNKDKPMHNLRKFASSVEPSTP